jgi:hypothetical protein
MSIFPDMGESKTLSAGGQRAVEVGGPFRRRLLSAAGLAILAVTASCFLAVPQDPDPVPPSKYAGRWIVIESLSAGEVPVGDRYVIADSTLIHYHLNPADTFGHTASVTQTSMAIRFKPNEFVTEPFYFKYWFHLEGDNLVQKELDVRVRVVSVKDTGAFPPAAWPWPPALVRTF